jgi:predicted ABC-type sugar transport system permease subunit
MYARKIMPHYLFSSFMIVWMMCSSTPLKKEISTPAVLMMQLGLGEICGGMIDEESSVRGSSVTGTIVSLFVSISKAPPFIDTSIVPEVPGCLYALFDYGLTVNKKYSLYKLILIEFKSSKE